MTNNLNTPQPIMTDFLSNFQTKINGIFNIHSETSAPIIISLGIFISGLIFTAFVKALSSYNNRKTTRKIFLQNLSLLSKGIRRQGRGYLILSEQIRFKGAKDKKNYSLEKVEIHQLMTLKQIGYESIFRSFFTGIENTSIRTKHLEKRVKAFNKIWETIEVVKIWQERLLNDGELFMDRLNSANSLREGGIKEYMNFIEPLLHRAPRNGINTQSFLGKYFYGIDGIIFSWQRQPDKNNPFIMHRSLVLPIRILDRKFSDHVDLVHTSSKHLMEASIGYQEMKNVISTYKNIYYDQSRSFSYFAKLMDISRLMLI
jgi:hypothetical protein